MSDNQSQSNDSAQKLIERLARRVSELRKIRGYPRRVLSEKSGVSPRYLAQLEAGDGNISVRLLHRIAVALDVDVDTLLADVGPFEKDAKRIGDLFSTASADVKQQVVDLLGSRNPAKLRAGRICLIGLRGAGKSTLGQMAEKALGAPFVELNDDIERAAGMSVSEIIAIYGKTGYRNLEAEALERVSVQHDRIILAVASGLVSEEATYEKLRSRFHTVWIKASLGEHMQRVRAQDDLRTTKESTVAAEQLKALLKAREALYQMAEAEVDTTDRTEKTSLNDLLGVIANRGFLEGSR